jgi:prepilin-type N-terminal cleavage/methylation domain-containing protein
MADKLNNKGLTLVELMIAMAIATIVIGSITYFMATSTKSYRKANDEITLQLEAQTILNQLNELIIEAYNVKMNEATDLLTIYRGDMTYYIKLENNKMLLNKKQSGLGITAGDTWILFGEYVNTFEVKDTGDNNDNSSILISFGLSKNASSYSVDNSLIALRNKIKAVPN